MINCPGGGWEAPPGGDAHGAVVTGGSVLEVRTVGPDDAPATIVLCHGFGADEADLVPLAQTLDAATPLRLAFPRAPHAFPPAWGPGRAWFPDTAPEIASFVTGELFAHLDELDPPSLADAGRSLAETVDTLVAGDGHSGDGERPRPDEGEANADDAAGSRAGGRRLFVGGFSQGAMVAAEAMLAAGLRADGLIVLSGALIAAGRWCSLVGSRPLAGVPVFQSHGDADPVLPFESGARLGELLDTAGAPRTFVRFSGGHGIPPEVPERLSSWIDAGCPAPR